MTEPCSKEEIIKILERKIDKLEADLLKRIENSEEKTLIKQDMLADRYKELSAVFEAVIRIDEKIKVLEQATKQIGDIGKLEGKIGQLRKDFDDFKANYREDEILDTGREDVKNVFYQQLFQDIQTNSEESYKKIVKTMLTVVSILISGFGIAIALITLLK